MREIRHPIRGERRSSDCFPTQIWLYVSVDDALTVSQDAGIEGQAPGDTTEEGDENDEECDPLPIPTRRELLPVFSVMSRFNQAEQFLSYSAMDKIESAMIRHVVTTKEQSLITDYLIKQ